MILKMCITFQSILQANYAHTLAFWVFLATFYVCIMSINKKTSFHECAFRLGLELAASFNSVLCISM